ncbi:Peptidoglycan glycosyltransferase [Lentibacillus sp. JNUCC-1]|uniref:transglycosylase domain-containing protein n=1 Tax=Lentibacillus sp. JNUCC-1 TaxID=2654513 RepID=UPI0012E725BB|nr:PBP1A family penicillin-binding protein [Lentibacillus sp. JNUCC-1]MUV37432.1 Peptidoglycan glycosyltransferase [Lentibacillus sp. JNUCC-1]
MKNQILKTLRITILGLAGLGIISIATIYLIAFILGPPDISTQEKTRYYDRTGDVIGEEHGLREQFHTALEDIPPSVINAVIASEDQRFYKHGGFNLKRIIGAAIADLKTQSLKEGASTITQQYARNLYLSHEKTWQRKLYEAFYTIRLEMHYDKDTILEGYLNTIYFGHGAYGIEAASRHFFDHPAEDLTLAEAAMLAGIPKGPSYYSPFNNYANAKKRQEHILNQMHEEDFVSKQAMFLAQRAHLDFRDPEQASEERFAPHFLDTVLKEAAHILEMDPEIIRSSGYKIHTTLDSALQQSLIDTAQNTIATKSDIETSAIAMAPESGSIRALIGGRSYDDSQFNRAIQAKRMPGSAFKPILYYAALEHGYNAKTRLVSKPTAFKIDDGEVYTPSNFNDYYAYEPITLAEALAVSDNIFAVKTNLFIGTDKLIQAARKFGIDRELPEVPSLALGTAAVTMADMTTAYSMIANGGHEVKAHTISSIESKDGKTVYERTPTVPDAEPVLDPKKTFILSKLMTGMFDTSLNVHMTVTGAPIAGQLSREYAGKTGSTEADRWMIGFSSDLVTGVWNGYDDNRTLKKAKESMYAKQIWADFMEKAHAGQSKKTFQAPPGVVGVKIDPESGLLATPYCDTRTTLYFEQGTEPKHYCNVHMPGDPQKAPKEKDKNNEKGIFEKWFDVFFGS